MEHLQLSFKEIQECTKGIKLDHLTISDTFIIFEIPVTQNSVGDNKSHVVLGDKLVVKAYQSNLIIWFLSDQ